MLVLFASVFLLFIFPFIRDSLDAFNDISVYVNTDIDFDVPEPSKEQIAYLIEQPFIESIYPYYLDEQTVTVNNRTRRTSILIADISYGEFAMYNSERLIEGSLKSSIPNQMYIDFAFQKDTGAKLGDTVSFSILDTPMTFEITAVFETNNRFLKNGAVAINLDDSLRELIGENRAYSGAFIVASDYSQANSYMRNDYRPLGRLRDRSFFDSDETYICTVI